MTASDSVKVARIQKQIADRMLTRDIILGVLGNPVLSFVGGSWALLALQDRYGEKRGFADFFERAAALTAVGGIATAQALAPLLPDLIKSGGEAAGTILTKAVPLLK